MNTRRNLLAVLGALLTTSTLAQDTIEDAPLPTQPREYDIELIIFEYVNGVRGGREDWDYIDTGRAAVAAEIEALTPIEPDDIADDVVPPAADIAEDEDPLVVAFQRLPAETYRLADQYQRLRGSRDYRPIVHTAWRQPVLSQEDETTFQLSSVAANTPTSLGGDVSVYVSRFLHLTLDLELAKDRSGTESVVYTLNERRKMRSAELHFFDHPRFGALALISKVEEAVDE
ncbi:MAG: CsiV family protein [Pseudomonadota bacterium]